MRLIDADELKRLMAESMTVLRFNQEHDGLIAEIIDNAPTVTPDKIQAIMSDYLVYRSEPQRPTGEWIRTALYGQTCYECDNCKLHYDCISNYCPNCGSYMRKEDNNATDSES